MIWEQCALECGMADSNHIVHFNQLSLLAEQLAYLFMGLQDSLNFYEQK
jgi:hypothetical protein